MPQNDGSNEQSATGNVLEFPRGQNVTDIKTVLESSKTSGLLLTPLQLLGAILKVVLRERITDAEIDKICSVYYDTVTKWYWPTNTHLRHYPNESFLDRVRSVV